MFSVKTFVLFYLPTECSEERFLHILKYIQGFLSSHFLHFSFLPEVLLFPTVVSGPLYRKSKYQGVHSSPCHTFPFYRVAGERIGNTNLPLPSLFPLPASSASLPTNAFHLPLASPIPSVLLQAVHICYLSPLFSFLSDCCLCHVILHNQTMIVHR